MAEVSHRLFGNGVYRLAVFRTNPNCQVCIEESSKCFLINCASSSSSIKEESVQDQVQALPRRRSLEKLSRLGKAENQQRCVTFVGATSFSLSSSRLIWSTVIRESLQACKSDLFLQKNLLSYRTSPWTKGAVFIHPDTFRSTQQLRAFCTALFILTDNGSEGPNCGQRALKLHPHILRGSTTRGYSWRAAEAHLLHRSKTAYYDILKVSPNATQSQIKTAYYKQSLIHHPDKNPGSEDATHLFSEINEAYTVLGNITLRRKYDRGILNQSDIQSAGRPSSRETTSRATSAQQHQHHQQRARRFSQNGGKPIFDFDAFYQAHYGEQLQRERAMRERKKQVEEMEKKKINKWKEQKVVELTLIMLVTMTGFLLASFRQ